MTFATATVKAGAEITLMTCTADSLKSGFHRGKHLKTGLHGAGVHLVVDPLLHRT